MPLDSQVSPRRRLVTVLLWLVLVLAAVWQITRTSFVADLSAFLPASPDAQQRVLIEQLQSGTVARTMLIGIDGGTAKQRADASRALAAKMRGSGLFEQVNNGETEAWTDIGKWIVEHRYQLSPAITSQHFTPEGLKAAIGETLSLLGTPLGNAVKPLLDRDPTGETTRIAEGLIPSSAPRSEEGVWSSRSGERAVLVAGTLASGSDLDGMQVAINRVRQEWTEVERAAPGLVLRLSGAPVFGVDSRAQIEREIHWLSAVGTVLVSSLLLVAFASLRALGVALLPVASGVLAGIATVSLVFGSVHGITLGFGTTLIGEAVDYAIYYLIQARGYRGQGGWRAWLQHGWPTVRLGLLTSICGFAALVFSGFPGLAQLGVFSVAGLVGAILATRFLLPVLMPEGSSGTGLRAQLGAFAGWAVRLLPRLRWPLLALGVAAAGVLLVRHELWHAELGSLSPVSKSAMDLDASLRADLSAGDARSLVVVQGPDLQATLQLAEAVVRKLEPLVDAGALAGVDSITRWLPSLATQQARQAALPDAAALQASLAQATAGGPLKAERLAPFVAEVQAAKALPPISIESFNGTALKVIVDAMTLKRADGSWVALLPLQPLGDKLDLPAVQQALQGMAGVQSLEIGAELTRLYARYLREAQTQALLGALAVVVLIGLTLRSWRRLLRVCQPLLLAVVLTMGGLAAFGVQLGILHLVGLLLVVAVGSNYALFFDMLQHGAAQRDTPENAARRGPAENTAPDSETLASLLLANLTMVLSFGLIALSSIPALASIGRVVAPGVLLALVLSAALAPRAVGKAPRKTLPDAGDAPAPQQAA